MPDKTKDAIVWALKQTYIFDGDTQQVTSDNPIFLIDTVRLYFNTNNIEYTTFNYDDLIPYL